MELKDRIATIIHVNQHTASSFAEELGIPRSRISHILNGRNKPSIDFIEKVLAHFPRVDPRWLITGKESLTKNESPPKIKEQIETTKVAGLASKDSGTNSKSRRIEKMIVFYTDYTFETYVQSKP